MTPNDELETVVEKLKADQATARILLEISRGLNEAANNTERIKVLSQLAIEAGAYMAHLMYFYENESGEQEWAEVVAGWPEGMMENLPERVRGRFRLSDFPTTSVLLGSRDKLQMFSDVMTDERIDQINRYILQAMGTRATVQITLSQAGKSLGVLGFYWAEPHEFTEQEIAVYQELPLLASPVIENCRLMDDLAQVLAERDEQQRFLRAVLDASPYTVYFKDRDSVYRLCNEAFALHHDREMNEILGKGVFELFPRDKAQMYRDEDLHVMEKGDQITFEHRMEKAAGTFFYESIKKPMYDENDEVVGLIAFDRDITERKQMENVLMSERNLLRTLIDALPDHIYAKDLECRTLLANLVQARSLGFDDPDEVTGKTDFEFYDRDIAQKIYEADQDVLQTGESVSLEEFFLDPEGRKRWYWSVKAPLRDANGKITGLVGMSRDVTEQKALEEKAAREREQQALIDAQRRALQELSTPIIPIMDRVIVMPLIGSIDTLRSKEITRALLSGISEYRARVVILDITGVPIVDSGVAAYLNKTIQAARLKGAHTIMTGITDAVTETVVELGLDWSGVETLDNLQTGLLTALNRLGIHLVRNQS